VECFKTSMIDVLSGICHGAVWRPLLLIIYINDLQEVCKVMLTKIFVCMQMMIPE